MILSRQFFLIYLSCFTIKIFKYSIFTIRINFKFIPGLQKLYKKISNRYLILKLNLLNDDIVKKFSVVSTGSGHKNYRRNN